MSRESGARLVPQGPVLPQRSSVGATQAPAQALPSAGEPRRLPRAQSKPEPTYEFDGLTPEEAEAYRSGAWLGPPVSFEWTAQDASRSHVAELVARIRVQAERMVAG